MLADRADGPAAKVQVEFGKEPWMLILAEGRIEGHFEQNVMAAARTWLGPTVDAGFLQHGYIDRSATRIWMVLSSENLASAPSVSMTYPSAGRDS